MQTSPRKVFVCNQLQPPNTPFLKTVNLPAKKATPVSKPDISTPGEIIFALVGDNFEAISLCVFMATKNRGFIQTYSMLLSEKQSRKITSSLGEVVMKALRECEGMPSQLEKCLKDVLGNLH